jgi:hypothetical protein
MTNQRFHLIAAALFVLALSMAGGGCESSKTKGMADKTGNAGRGRGKGWGNGPAESPIREIMGKLAKGPESLVTQLDTELKSDSPPWDTVQTQTKQLLSLAIAMGAEEPPQGEKASWAKLTAEFAGSASDMNRAALAEDKDAALDAHDKITNSCIVCHKAHKGGKG